MEAGAYHLRSYYTLIPAGERSDQAIATYTWSNQQASTVSTPTIKQQLELPKSIIRTCNVARLYLGPDTPSSANMALIFDLTGLSSIPC